MAGTVLVVGATGKVGARVVEGLVARGAEVRAATRAPGRAGARLPGAAVPVLFDYDRPDTYAPALAGVEHLFLSVRPGDDDSDLTAIPLVRQAVASGVRRIVSLTAMGVDRLGDNALRRIEQQVEASGLDWTHLRPNFFMQIFAVPPLLDQLRASRAIRLPAGDARLSFVDVRDIAGVAVASLLDEGHAGKAYTLTGPEGLDHHEVAAALSAAILPSSTGKERRFIYEPLEDEEARRTMAAGGLPPARVERLLGFYRAVRAGACAAVSPDVEGVLARPAITFAQFAREHAAAWASPRP